VDGSGSLSHRGLDQGSGDAPAPVVRIDPEGAKLEAIGVLFERDEPDDAAGVLSHPKPVGFHPGVIQAELNGERDGIGDVLGEGFPDPHSGPLYHRPKKKGQPDKAKMACQKALAINPNYAEAKKALDELR
jgi:hypothetical protein